MKKKYLTDTKRQVVNEIHKSARINFKRRRIILKSIDDLFQADLVEMIPYYKQNKGFKYILVVINCFTKFAWALPLKSKTAIEVTKHMQKVLDEQVPKNLHTDLGKEFYNKHFQELMKKYNINHYSTFTEKKASIVERLNRTLKNRMWKQFNYNGNYNWISMLQNIVDDYNNTKHTTIRMKPIKVKKKHEKMLLDTVYSHLKMSELPTKFHVGDHVRISKIRGIFDKKYTANWSTEIFTIRKIRLTNPTTYLLKDEHNKEIQGAFYTEELQKVKFPNVYLVEKVLKKQGNKVFVKWLGFNSKHNSWINKTDIMY